MFGRRSTSFGYGERHGVRRRETTPSPGAYKIYSDFQNIKGKGRSFGLSRERERKGSEKNTSFLIHQIPGPGAYNISIDIGKNACKYTLRPKTINLGRIIYINR